MSTRKRHKARVIESNSDTTSDEGVSSQTPPQTIKLSQARSSERIRIKNTRVFQMPSREKVLKNISTAKSPNKSFESLKPRKLVNNFMRVTHRYNHDRASDTSEDDDDFIDDDVSQEFSPQSTQDSGDGSTSQSNENDGNQQSETETTFHLKPGLHASRLDSDSDNLSSEDVHDKSKMRHNSIIASDSDEEGVIESAACSETYDSSFPNSREEYRYISDSSMERGCRHWPECSDKSQPCLKKDKIYPACSSLQITQQENHSSDSESELISPKPTSKLRKRSHSAKKKKRLISSGSESEEGCSPTKRTVLLESDSSESEDMEKRLYSSNADTSDDERLPSERAQHMACRKQQKRNLFEALKTKRKGVKKIE